MKEKLLENNNQCRHNISFATLYQRLEKDTKPASIENMYEQRMFLYLLKRLQYSKGKFLDHYDYSEVVSHGVDQNEFLHFALKYWDLFSILMLFLHIYKVPKKIKINAIEKNEESDLYSKIKSITIILEDKELIVTDYAHIKITWEGERFTKFLVFYNTLLERYSTFNIALFSVLATIITLNIPSIILKFTFLFVWLHL